MNELFLCAKCAEIIRHSYIAEELPYTSGNDKCGMCSKMRFGSRYIIRK